MLVTSGWIHHHCNLNVIDWFSFLSLNSQINTCILQNRLCVFCGFRNGAILVHICVETIKNLFQPKYFGCIQSLLLPQIVLCSHYLWNVDHCRSLFYKPRTLGNATYSYKQLLSKERTNIIKYYNHWSFNFLHPMASKLTNGVIFL